MIKDAVFNLLWSGTSDHHYDFFNIEAPCKVNMETREVFDIDLSGVKSYDKSYNEHDYADYDFTHFGDSWDCLYIDGKEHDLFRNLCDGYYYLALSGWEVYGYDNLNKDSYWISSDTYEKVYLFSFR